MKTEQDQHQQLNSPPATGHRGFTLVELLIVLAVLAVLAAVVIPNITGVYSRGGEQAWATDQKTLQMAVSTFHFDEHACDTSPASDTWDSTKDPIPGHYFPTASADSSPFTVEEIITEANTTGAIYDFADEAIWMGLLFNSPADTSSHDKDHANPLTGEMGPYLNDSPPPSASNHNYSSATGSYTWVIARDAKVYGLWWDNSSSTWRSDYRGVYP
jgi:prepilin-type N-terminal cleavage/methylation domain-containing protein